MSTTPLDLDAPATAQLCGLIGTEAKAVRVPSRPEKGTKQNDCFDLVAKRVQREGGEPITGWALWIWPNVLAEAEYHQIWRSPGGDLVDLNPRPAIAVSSITFVADLSRPYKGRQRDNFRLALSTKPGIHAFIAMCERQFQIMNTGDLADQHGEVHLPPDLHREWLFLEDQKLRMVPRFLSQP